MRFREPVCTAVVAFMSAVYIYHILVIFCYHQSGYHSVNGLNVLYHLEKCWTLQILSNWCNLPQYILCLNWICYIFIFCLIIFWSNGINLYLLLSQSWIWRPLRSSTLRAKGFSVPSQKWRRKYTYRMI